MKTKYLFLVLLTLLPSLILFNSCDNVDEEVIVIDPDDPFVKNDIGTSSELTFNLNIQNEDPNLRYINDVNTLYYGLYKYDLNGQDAYLVGDRELVRIEGKNKVPNKVILKGLEPGDYEIVFFCAKYEDRTQGLMFNEGSGEIHDLNAFFATTTWMITGGIPLYASDYYTFHVNERLGNNSVDIPVKLKNKSASVRFYSMIPVPKDINQINIHVDQFSNNYIFYSDEASKPISNPFDDQIIKIDSKDWNTNEPIEFYYYNFANKTNSSWIETFTPETSGVYLEPQQVDMIRDTKND